MQRLAVRLVILTGLSLWPAVAPAQEGNPQPLPSQSGQQRSPKFLAPPIVPDSKTVEKDVEEATGEIEQRERDDKLIRETVRTPSRRPDLEHGVEQGIQALNVENALRRQ